MKEEKPLSEKPLSEKDMETLQKELNKKIKRLKPKKPAAPSKTRLKTMAQKKVEGGLDDLKKFARDKLELKFYENQLAEEEKKASGVIASPVATSKSPQQVAIKPQPQGTILKDLKLKDLKGVDDTILEKFVDLKMLDKNPELYKYLRNKPSKNDFKDRLLEKIIEKNLLGNNDQESKSDATNEILLKLIDKALTPQQQQPDNQITALMEKMHEREMKMMEKLNEAREERHQKDLYDLQQSIPPSPFQWLQHEKEKQEQIRNLFANPEIKDYKGQLALKQQEHKHEIEMEEIKRNMEKDRMEQAKGTEFTGLIKEGIQKFTDSITKTVGQTVGQIGKDMLGSSPLPTTVPLESIEQGLIQAPQLPSPNDPLQNLSPNNIFNPNNPNNVLQPQPQPINKSKETKTKKYAAGFRTYGK